MRLSHVRIWYIASIAVLGAVLPQVHADPVGTAFTYQGRLVDGGNPANGLYDFEFTLYPVDFPVPMGTVVADDVEVSNGLFTADLDFGSEHFQGAGLELEIAVRPGASTGDYTILSPRQELTPVPYALYALDSAGSWDSSGNNFYTYRSVGIGTEPGVELDVVGTVRASGFQLTDSPVSGYVLTADATGVGTWQPSGAGSSPWTVAGSDIYYDAGNVGVGTQNPIYPLHAVSDTTRTMSVQNTGTAGNVTAVHATAHYCGVQAYAVAESGTAHGLDAYAMSPDGHAVYAFNEADSGDAIAVLGETASPDGIGVKGRSDGPDGCGVYGRNYATTGNAIGGYFKTNSDDGRAVCAEAMTALSGYAGYFVGRSYFSSNVGIGTAQPGSPLTVAGVVESLTGGFKFPDGTIQTTAGGGGGGITLPYSNSVTSSSPAFEIENLGSGEGLRGVSANGIGVEAEGSGTGVYFPALRAESTNSDGIAIFSTSESTDANAVFVNKGTGDIIKGFSAPTGGDLVFQVTNNGTTRMDGFRLTSSPTAGHVLTCDASGNGTWQEPTGGGGLTLPYEGTVSTPDAGFSVINSNAEGGVGVRGANSYYGSSGELGSGKYGVFAMTARGDAAAGYFHNTGGGDVIKGISTNGEVFRVASDGITHVDVLAIEGGADLAEQFDVRASQAEAQPGMVVCIDAANPGKLIVSSTAYDRKVAGIISGAGGIAPGMQMGQKGSVADGEHPVALTGRVYVWADASRGPIQPGDLLTASDVPGHAMKVDDYERAQGAILGKAMTALEEGRGLVLVLVTLQ